MSIPGLGQIPTAPAPSSTRTIVLRPLWEYRFEVSFHKTVTLKLLSGTAEKDGTELAVAVAYRFRGSKTKILTYHGCELEVDGACDDEFVAEYARPEESPANSYLNLHGELMALRAAARRTRGDAPRVMVAGPSNSGKTSVVRTLAAYAVRAGEQPLVVNTDPRHGMLTLPGTLVASVFATIMDVESGDGWGSTSSSGPSLVPAKLPLVYHFGYASPEEDASLYKQLVSRLAMPATARFRGDPAVASAGILIDTPRVSEKSQVGLDCLVHIAEELSVNIVVVLGSPRMTTELSRRFASEKTSLGEPIRVVGLNKSEGVVERDEGFMQQVYEAAIKEYFFGDPRRVLSPSTQFVEMDSLVIFQAVPDEIMGGTTMVRTEPSSTMSHWTLAVMNASVKDSPDMIRMSSVMGFVYVGDVDKTRRRVQVLSPVSGRLDDRPMILGKWPEPYINLLG